MSETSPTARTLLCLELISSRPGVTAEALAADLGVTTRAVRRYVQILREAQIPVEASSGPYGGYRVGRGVRVPPLLFSPAEAVALTMAVLADPEASGKADEPLARALAKLVQVLPGTVGRRADAVRRQAATARTAPRRPDPTRTAELAEAVARRRRVSIDYRSASGRALVRTVDPWAVVVRYGTWYLLCHDHTAAAVRTFRVDRVEAVTVLEEPFTPPDDLDAVALTEQHLGSGRAHPTRIVFAAPYADVAPWIGPVMGRLEPLGEERCVLVGSTDNPPVYVGEWLARVPYDFTVEADEPLREATRALAARLAAAAPPTG